MALHVPRTTYQSMMKDGAKHYKGLEEAVFRNIKVCKEFAQITRSSFGPQGMNKIVINHLDRRFVTNDATTIINELEVQHPAAKIIVMAAKMQEQEVGDGTNLVVQLASELLNEADGLLRMGLTPNDIIDGYRTACDYAIPEIQKMIVHKVTDYDNFEQMREIVSTAIMSKQESYHEFLSKLVTEACSRFSCRLTQLIVHLKRFLVRSKSKNTNNFSVDNVATVKILGSGLLTSENVNGLVFVTSVLGQINRVKDAKIAVYTVAFDLMGTETKGTVLLSTANELSSFTAGEENLIGKLVEQLKAAGVNVVITSDKVSDQALDYANRHGIMVLRLVSKFDIQRVCRATTAVALPTMRTPTPEELGHCSEVYITEYGNTTCCIFKQELEESSTSTIVLRGSSMGFLDDIDRAVDDGVNAFKMALRENGYVSGCGSTELTVGNLVIRFSKTKTDLSQYSIEKFGQALHVVPKILSENAGFSSSEALAKLQAQQSANKQYHIGLDISGDQIQTIDAIKERIFENAYVKIRAVMQATHAATTILAVDQIIMAKPAGGPRVRAPGPIDQD